MLASLEAGRRALTDDEERFAYIELLLQDGANLPDARTVDIEMTRLM